MPRRSQTSDRLPIQVETALTRLGESLRIARKRRGDTLRTFASRLQVSVPTLRKMERGDPTVSVAVFAMALWLIGRVHLLQDMADPASDETALLLEISKLKKPTRRAK